MKNAKFKDSKLLKIFKLLNKEETRRFKKLLLSPFFTTNTHLLKIYDYLIKYYPNFTHPKLTQHLIFAYLFPDRIYNDNKLRMLFREFTRQLEDFLVIKAVRDNEFERKKQLVHVYGQRNEMELFKKGTFRLLEALENIQIKDKNHFFERQQLIQYLVYHPATPKTAEMINLQTKIMEHLELHYWSNKVWLSCNLLSTQQFLNIDLQDYELSLENLPTNYLLKDASLATFYQAFQFLKSPSDPLYFSLKTTYLAHVERLEASDKRDIYSYLSNYAVRQHNQGDLKFLEEVFNWNNIGLKYKLLVESGIMDKVVFKNCCLTAIRLNAFNWVEKFIKDYQNFLNEKDKEDIITLCQAYLYFYKENYTQLIETIQSYRFHQFRDNLGAKGLLLRSYFELYLVDNSYFGIFVNYSSAFEKYLRRNESSTKNVLDGYLNFIFMLRRIIKSIHGGKWNTSTKERIIGNIKDNNVTMKQWLIHKINNIKI